jgi:hypothetical protein
MPDIETSCNPRLATPNQICERQNPTCNHLAIVQCNCGCWCGDELCITICENAFEFALNEGLA